MTATGEAVTDRQREARNCHDLPNDREGRRAIPETPRYRPPDATHHERPTVWEAQRLRGPPRPLRQRLAGGPGGVSSTAALSPRNALVMPILLPCPNRMRGRQQMRARHVSRPPVFEVHVTACRAGPRAPVSVAKPDCMSWNHGARCGERGAARPPWNAAGQGYSHSVSEEKSLTRCLVMHAVFGWATRRPSPSPSWPRGGGAPACCAAPCLPVAPYSASEIEPAVIEVPQAGF